MNKKEKRKSLVFYVDKDQDVLDHLDSIPNINDYIKNLVRNDINRAENEKTFIRENIKKEVTNYTNTKSFKSLVLDLIKEYSEISEKVNKKGKGGK